MSAPFSQQPLNAAQPLDVPGSVPRSRLSFRAQEAGTRRMALKLRDGAGDYPRAIRDALEARGYGGRDGVIAGEYRLPLGRVRSIPVDDDETESDVGLMPVIPVRFADPEGERLAPLRDGWMYVFINGHLWREIRVSNEGEVFRDVNLARHQGRDDRPAACEVLFHHVSLPYRMNGAEPAVEVAYADVQWSWATIERMGGFDPEDHRYCPDLDVYEPYNVTVDDSLREARCQRIDLAAYDGDPDINRLRETFLVPTETAETHCNASGDSDQPPQLPGLTEDDITAGFAIMALHDPLGVAMEFIGTIQDETEALKACIEEIDQHEHVESAVMAYQAFFNESLHETRPGAMSSEHYADRSEGATVLRRAARDLDRDMLEEILRVGERRAIRRRIRTARKVLAHWLDGRCPDGADVADHIAQPVTVLSVLADYAALPPAEYWRLWATVNGLIGGAGLEPSRTDSGYDAEPDEDAQDEDDPIDGWVRSLAADEHPLFGMLFPGEDQVSVDDDASPDTSDLDAATGDTRFRPGAFALMMGGTSQRGAGWSVGRDVAWLAREMVMDFMLSVQRQWQSALEGQHTVSVGLMLRLAKAGQFPDLEGARLVRSGERIPKGYTVLGAQVDRLDRMLRPARRDAAKDAVRNPGADAVVTIGGDSVASTSLYGLANDSASINALHERKWKPLFHAKAKDGLYYAQVDLTVVPEVPETVRELSQPDAEPPLTSSRAVRAAQVGLPPIIAVFEVVNIVSVARHLREGGERTSRNRSEMALSAVGLAFALTEASIYTLGREGTTAAIGRVVGHAAAEQVVRGSLAVPMVGRVPTLAVIGAGLAGFGAALAATDMRYRLQRGETAAGLAHGVEAAALTGLMASNLIVRVPQGGLAAIFKLGPWGWAFLATGIVAGTVARHLIRGPSERWAYYGPFSTDPDRRLTEEYAGLEPRQVRLALESLLAGPQVTIVEDERFSPSRVRVEVRAPAAVRATDGLELYATWEGQDEQQPLEVVATGQLPDDEAGELCQAWWFRLSDPHEWPMSWTGSRVCTIRARARLRREGDGTLPFNPSHAGFQANDSTIDPDGETEDWAYADELTIRKTQRQINQEF